VIPSVSSGPNLSQVLPIISIQNMVLPVLSVVGRPASFKILSIVSISARSVPKEISIAVG